jgi:hypothetical protein
MYVMLRLSVPSDAFVAAATGVAQVLRPRTLLRRAKFLQPSLKASLTMPSASCGPVRPRPLLPRFAGDGVPGTSRLTDRNGRARQSQGRGNGRRWFVDSRRACGQAGAYAAKRVNVGSTSVSETARADANQKRSTMRAEDLSRVNACEPSATSNQRVGGSNPPRRVTRAPIRWGSISSN